MTSTVRKILVVGGNGFIGSAVCKAALARGIQVTSVSSSGAPYRTPKGHTPAWASKVDWQKGDALHPQGFAHLFPHVDGVVHTLGTLLEDGAYKRAVSEGNLPALLGGVVGALRAGGGNPLEKGVAGDSGGKASSYEALNRDSALRVCEAFLSSPAGDEPGWNANAPRPFIYISAEDIFRPVIPARYIETKRAAERGIAQMMSGNTAYRGVYIRPSLVYHAHLRPLTTPAAALLDLSAAIHRRVPQSIPTPSSILRSLGSRARFGARASGSAGQISDSSSPLESIANALVLPPIHVDHVADAICVALDSRGDAVRGVVGVRRMHELIGWSEDHRARDGMGLAET